VLDVSECGFILFKYFTGPLVYLQPNICIYRP
jgi:hypothetical protein